MRKIEDELEEAERVDYPFDQVAAAAAAMCSQGGTVHQKWTCCHCGARQTMDVPNTFYKAGQCEECRRTTIIKECNFMVMWSTGG